ncbi:MAG: chloride channel protein [Leeuwenhoekiella sp.]|uniref:Chloride channel protein n=1 Tax=Leeuwenhoekiella nanhaiensis TaxID=1655491 RepID=A0A2G1VVS8_9FLAO|nr:chloride channel protein [Leeuwenhoekiella nanhaiensis]PHQ30865.1 chloride channel protein [Leeuwenhoekiella nanhaiensis]PHR95722.1 MAG: chloride channel protein [Leeuwenhoekiella sp.]
MPGKKPLLHRFHAWRYKHISKTTFVYLLSAMTGLLAGLGAVLIKNITHVIQNLLEGGLVENYRYGFYFLFPIIGLAITVLIVKFVIRNPMSHGVPATLRAISKRKGLLRNYQAYASLITAPITVGFGGSVGLESPTVVTGAGMSSYLSRIFHMDQAHRTLLLGCAAAGAMSCIFKAPIAAIIFAVEVFSLDLTLLSLMPLLLASLSAILTSYFFFGSDTILPFTLKDAFSIEDFPYYIILGIVAGLVSVYFSKAYFQTQKFYARWQSVTLRLIIAGGSLGVLLYFIPPLYGEGFDMINQLLEGKAVPALGSTFFNDYLDNIWVVIGLLAGLVFFKVIAAAITFAGGGIGGIFAPVLFMGSVMGNCLAKVVNNLGIAGIQVSESNFTLVGMTGLMAGVLHAPLTAIFLIAEITGGYGLFIPLMTTAALAYGINKYFLPHSVYGMELGLKGELITHDKDQAVLTLLNVESVIESNFIRVRPEMTLGEMVKNAVAKSARNLFPVVNEDDELVGVITLDDIREIMFDSALYDTTEVRSLMHAAPEYIYLESDSAKAVMRKFQESGAWNLPVIKNGKYHGFISKSKLLTAYRRMLVSFSRK